MSNKVKMKFSRLYIYDGKQYEAGEIYEIEPHLVQRWLNRQCEIVEEMPKAVAEEPPTGDDKSGKQKGEKKTSKKEAKAPPEKLDKNDDDL